MHGYAKLARSTDAQAAINSRLPAEAVALQNVTEFTKPMNAQPRMLPFDSKPCSRRRSAALGAGLEQQ
jgi:hypothetical protein